jgi:hypothetical protein
MEPAKNPPKIPYAKKVSVMEGSAFHLNSHHAAEIEIG